MRPVKWGQLKNGFRFFTQYDSRKNNVSGIGVKCGSIHDPPGKSGMAHFVEHNLVRESLRYPDVEVNSIIERYLGGLDGYEINVRTDRVSTFYGHNELLRRRHMFKCFDMFASLLEDKIINQKGINTEGGAVHQEYYQFGLDSMPALADDLIHGIMYSDNPARNRIDCNPDELRGITANQARYFARKRYVPNNMFAIMLGPKFEEVKRIVEQHFNEWNGAGPPVLKYDGHDNFPTLKGIKSQEVVRDIHQYHVVIGFPTECMGSEDDEALEVIARIWSSRLMQRLREENQDFDKGVYRSLAYTSRSFIHGLIYCWFPTSSKEFALQGAGIALEEAYKLKSELVHERLHDDIIENLDLAYLDDFTNTADRLCERIIEAVCNKDEDLVRLHSYRDRLYKVGRRKIRAVANRYFTDNYARVVIGPTTLFT